MRLCALRRIRERRRGRTEIIIILLSTAHRRKRNIVFRSYAKIERACFPIITGHYNVVQTKR